MSAARLEGYAFAPGVDPASLDIQLDHGLLSISGERGGAQSQNDDSSLSAYANERFSGRFKRTVNLSKDADPEKVNAQYRNGVLHISVARQASAQPKRITIQ